MGVVLGRSEGRFWSVGGSILADFGIDLEPMIVRSFSAAFKLKRRVKAYLGNMSSSSGSDSRNEAVLKNLHEAKDINVMFYNVGIKDDQVKTPTLYENWILGKLRNDVQKSILLYSADIIAISELGRIEFGLGNALAKWKNSNGAPKTGNLHLVEDMLHELVDGSAVDAKNPAGFEVYASNHYGIIIAKDTVRLIDLPHAVGPVCTHQPWRMAQRCIFTSAINSAVKPVELWNVHAPASKIHPYGPLAREQSCSFLQQKARPRAIWGGDINQSMYSLNVYKDSSHPWTPLAPGNSKHGDVVCTRDIDADILHIEIGKGEAEGVSDAHVMVGVALHPEIDTSALKPGNDNALPSAEKHTLVKPIL